MAQFDKDTSRLAVLNYLGKSVSMLELLDFTFETLSDKKMLQDNDQKTIIRVQKLLLNWLKKLDEIITEQ